MLSVLFIFPLLLLVWFLYSCSAVGGNSGRSNLMSVAGLALLGLMLEFVLNVMGLVGAYKKNVQFLRLYMNYSFLSTVVFTIVCLLITVLHLKSTLTSSNYDAFRSHFLVWYVAVGLASAILQTLTLLMLKTRIYRVKHAEEAKVDSLSKASDDDHARDSKEFSNHGTESEVGEDDDGWSSLLDVIEKEGDKIV